MIKSILSAVRRMFLSTTTPLPEPSPPAASPLQDCSVPPAGTCAWAVWVVAEASGEYRQGLLRSVVIVDRARRVLEREGVLDYVDALRIAGHRLTRMAKGGDPAVFEAWLKSQAKHDIDGWWAAVRTGKAVRVPAGVTDAFIQRGGGQPGIVIKDQPEQPIVDAEGRMRVVQISTGQPVIPRVTVRGSAPVEIEGGGRCSHETIDFSKWRLAGGWWRAGAPPRVQNGEPAGGDGQKADNKPGDQKVGL